MRPVLWQDVLRLAGALTEVPKEQREYLCRVVFDRAQTALRTGEIQVDRTRSMVMEPCLRLWVSRSDAMGGRWKTPTTSRR